MPRSKNSIIKRASIVLATLVSLAILMGIVFKLDVRWNNEPLAKDVEQLSKRLDQKIMIDRANAIQERMWTLEDKFGSVDGMPQEIKDEYRKLRREYEQIMKALNSKNK